MGTPIVIPPYGAKVGISTNIGTSFGFLSNAVTLEPSSSGEGARVQSSSANDTSAGTGIQKVRVRYFNVNWILNDEFVTLNGTTPVSLAATDIRRIESFEVFQAGLFGSAQGTITLTSTDGTRLFAQIDIAGTIFTRAIHTVSPGKIGRISDIVVNCQTAGGVQFGIFAEVDNTSSGGGIVSLPDLGFTLANNTMSIPLIQPIRCDASQSTVGLRMGVATKGLTSGQIGSASFHFSETL